MVVSGKHVFVCEGKRSPNDFSRAELEVWFDKVRAADFMITLTIQPGADQVSFVREEQDRIAVERQMNRRAMTWADGPVGFPNLLSRACIQADEVATDFGPKHVIAQNYRHAGMAQHSERKRL